MGKIYDQAYKTEICKRTVEGGEAVSAISREVGISENTLYGWVARYRENREKPFVGSGHIKPEDEAFKSFNERIKSYGKKMKYYAHN